MKHLGASAQAAVAISLCAIAGSVDAIGFLGSEVFVANMTGNTVLVGIAMVQGDLHALQFRLATVACFFVGAMSGRLLLTRGARALWLPLALEVMLLAVATPLSNRRGSVFLAAAAMGVQATAATQFAGISMSTVVITSAIARCAEGVVAKISDSGATAAPALIGRLNAAACTAYLLGACAGAALPRVPGTLGVPAVGMAALLLWVIISGRSRRTHADTAPVR